MRASAAVTTAVTVLGQHAILTDSDQRSHLRSQPATSRRQHYLCPSDNKSSRSHAIPSYARMPQITSSQADEERIRIARSRQRTIKTYARVY